MDEGTRVTHKFLPLRGLVVDVCGDSVRVRWDAPGYPVEPWYSVSALNNVDEQSPSTRDKGAQDG